MWRNRLTLCWLSCSNKFTFDFSSIDIRLVSTMINHNHDWYSESDDINDFPDFNKRRPRRILFNLAYDRDLTQLNMKHDLVVDFTKISWNSNGRDTLCHWRKFTTSNVNVDSSKNRPRWYRFTLQNTTCGYSFQISLNRLRFFWNAHFFGFSDTKQDIMWHAQ